MSEWQPIETAPKDGKDVLVFCADSMEQFVAYREGRSAYFTYAHNAVDGRKTMCVPTHWMPLPSPPKEKGEEK